MDVTKYCYKSNLGKGRLPLPHSWEAQRTVAAGHAVGVGGSWPGCVYIQEAERNESRVSQLYCPPSAFPQSAHSARKGV